jgi:hypothetical protein
MIRLLKIGLLLLLVSLSATLQGEEARPLQKLDEKTPVKTTGGILFWGDVLFNNGWHVQKNVASDSYRLLDANDIQRAYGTLAECKSRLDEIQAEEGVLPMTGTAVIVLHGFGANAVMTQDLGDWLRERGTHDYVFCMSYPSTMQSILDHAKMLDSVVRNLPPTVKRIDFVGHSLGSLVLRRYLSGPLEENWQVPENMMEYRQEFSPDPRVGRCVMLGPPNHGAVLAEKLIGNSSVRKYLTGASGEELGTKWDKAEKSLGIPCCPFMVVSGGRGNKIGYSLLIPGDDDGVVSTEGTMLEGMEKWMFFNVVHNELLQSPAVFTAVEKFLLRGE